MQPFVRRWSGGRPSATALVVVLSLGAGGAQGLVHLLLAGQPTQHIFWPWLALTGAGIEAGHWWEFLSYGVLHDGPLHLIGNMLLLYFAGREVEPIIGPKHFLAIYTLGNVLGGVAHWLAMPWQTLVGVSPGVAAVLVAFTTVLPELEVTVNLFFVIPLRLRAKYLAFGLISVCALGWWFPAEMRGLTSIGPVGMIAASLFAWAYVKQLGFGNPLPIQRMIFERRQRAARLDRMPSDQFITLELDPILEKIARDGIKSLSRAERKLLEQGSAKVASKPPRK